jgi:predicted Zn finger-like uncharacterized protein
VKFLCDQCKAKYQIADDKVAGKTVKMKCRKCGHLIEVRAAVTESVEAGESLQPKAAPMATSLSRVDQARPSRDALAGAFAKSVKDEEPGARSIALSPGDEWYVAINGVPVGPVRIGEIRRKAATGGVTEDSLCWQEGFEEWRPVKAVPELVAMVREANSSGRASLVPGPESRPPGRPPMRQASSPAVNRISAIPGAPSIPRPGPAAASGLPNYDDDDETVVGTGSIGNLTAALAANAAPRGLRPVSVAPDPFAVPPPAQALQALQALEAAPAHANPFAVPTADPFAAATVVSSAPAAAFAASAMPSPIGSPLAPAALPSSSPRAAAQSLTHPTALSRARTSGRPVADTQAQPRRAGPAISVPALALLVICGAFGITAAIVLLKPAPTVVVAAPSATAATSAPTASATATIAAGDIPPVDSSTPAPADSGGTASRTGAGTKSGTSTGSGSGGKIAAAPSATAATGKTDPSIAALLNGSGSGPSAGSGSGSSGGGSALTQDQIESVVRMRSAQVKRSCWEHSATSAKSNNTTVALTISGSGTVSSSSASGNDATISHCIENATRSWQFPPSSGSTTVNIPFHFLSQ